MAEIALICDTHAGVRNDAQVFHDISKKFYDKIFFPEIEKRGIRDIIHLGDIVDRRKFINFHTACRLRDDFIKPLQFMGCRMDLILGNHDIFYRDSMDISIGTEFLSGFEHLKYYEYPVTIPFYGLPILFVPWICESNRERTAKAIKESNAKVCFGHLELYGFEQYRGSVALHGEDPITYNKFDLVCSGHYHHRSERGNIHYLGSTCQHNWADHGDERGFHIFDTNTLKLTFIRNPYDMFIKVHYDDNEDCLDLDFSELSGKYVKVIVRNRNKQALYDQFLSRVDEAGAVEYSVVDDHLNMDLNSADDIITDSTDTLSLIREYVATVGTETQKLDSLMIDLYKEAHASNE